MLKNLASWDRVLRLVIGALLLSLVFVGPQTLWGLLGLVPLATGLCGTCPVYTLFGASTCPAPASRKLRFTKVNKA